MQPGLEHLNGLQFLFVCSVIQVSQNMELKCRLFRHALLILLLNKIKGKTIEKRS